MRPYGSMDANRTAKAVAWLKANYMKPLRVGQLAHIRASVPRFFTLPQLAHNRQIVN